MQNIKKHSFCRKGNLFNTLVCLDPLKYISINSDGASVISTIVSRLSNFHVNRRMYCLDFELIRQTSKTEIFFPEFSRFLRFEDSHFNCLRISAILLFISWLQFMLHPYVRFPIPEALRMVVQNRAYYSINGRNICL